MNRLIILHGFGGRPDKHWYNSLGQALADRFSVTIPALPNPEVGKMEEWLAALAALRPDQQSTLVGHSLGGTLILRYLEQASLPIAAFFTVGSPINDLARNDLHATGFFERDFIWSTIKQRSPKRLVIGSTDDQSVPFWQAEYIAKQIDGELVTFTDKGHFNKAADFPELVDLITQHVEKTNM